MRQGVGMSMVHECAHADCGVLTMGELCLDHEREQDQRLDPALFEEERAGRGGTGCEEQLASLGYEARSFRPRSGPAA
jgi:hypothetical protein